jgi:hypothetical protein
MLQFFNASHNYFCFNLFKKAEVGGQRAEVICHLSGFQVYLPACNVFRFICA